MAAVGSDKGIPNNSTNTPDPDLNDHVWSVRTIHPRQGVGEEAKGDHTPFLTLNFEKILVLFLIGSVAGLVLENICHLVLYGGYENRYGLVWGPFSPMYGVGVVVFTVLLNRLWHYSNVVIFIVSMVVGSTIEFVTSWWMEHFFGAIAWSYEGTFLNIHGRVNLVSALVWGTLGLAWARVVVPLIKRGFDHVNWESMPMKASTVLLTAFLAVDIVVTVQAINRDSERADNLPATTPLDQFLDEHFPTDWMQEHFGNMSIYGPSQ